MAEILARLVYSQEDRVLHDVLQELEDLVSLLATPGLEEASRKELYREVGRVVSWHQPNPFLPKLPRRVLARWGYTGAFPVRRLLNENPELHYNIVASVGSLTRVRMTLPAPDVTGQWFTRVTTGPSTPPDAKSNCIWCDIQLRTMGYVMEEEQ
jgi:hypothetical protein